MTNTIQHAITQRLQEAFAPEHLSVIDESAQHAGHREAGSATESHFRIIITARSLEGKSRVMQHKAIYSALAEYIGAPVHALAIEIRTPKITSSSI